MRKSNFEPALILGATGSVGRQALDVARRCAIPVRGVSANTNWREIERAVREFRVPAAAMVDENAAKELRAALSDTNTRVFAGEAGVLDMIRESDATAAVNAIVGQAGLLPTLSVIDAGKRLALANKESLVVAGEIVMRRAKEKGVKITPVDSEHSAIYQSLRAGRHGEIKKLILTASGGPFRGMNRAQLEKITVADALAHPTWKMGAKITVDSATMMNKGFEVIEAAHLFRVPADKIEVVVHRESIIHSMVEYIDNSVIAELSVPDMRLCVQYALTAPARVDAVIPELSLTKVGKLTFLPPDEETFPLLPAARAALAAGGGVPAVLNAANEVAVAAFLAGKISLPRLFDTVLGVIADMPHAKDAHTLDEILTTDREAREHAETRL